ncbi:efflux RND transporter periplasmic adaptor subunit [Nisaea sediminum]|uniref:efflux RND transporter periplasmic adaptor subunit n=1 Tax=Nisaea sediminum TaxID=2775867 RepID=UPI0018667EF5|nr:efflux RND transporter periplasmic adaptor subunit [Nisaea sediminum]
MPSAKHLRIFAVALSAIVLLSACDEAAQTNQAAAPKARPAMPVGTIVAAAEDIPIVNDLPGRIAPTEIAEVRPRVSGLLIKRIFQQGALVEAGDVLYRIDPAPFKIQVDSARATLARAESVQKRARLEADRQTELRTRKVSSAQQLDNAIAALAQADADVAAARAGLASAELDLQYTEVKAPIGGRIGRALVTEGALVGTSSEEPLAVIRQLDPVYADFTQSAKQLRALRAGIKAGNVSLSEDGAATIRLNFDDGAAYPLTGRLLLQESTVDSTTGQITLRGEFPNPDFSLLPGMYVRVQIEQGIRRNAVAVPQQAIQRDTAGKARVYVVKDDMTLELRYVELGAATGNRWIVESGIAVGEQVVVEGFQKVGPGAPVAPKPWEPKPQQQAAAGKQ